MSQPLPTAAWAEPRDHFPEVSLAPYWEMLEREFGIPPAVFAPFYGYQPNRETIWIVQRTARLPLAPRPFAAGMPFFYYRMRFPRPTTPTVLRWGHLATRNVYELDKADLPTLFGDLKLAAPRLDPALVPGYQLLRCRGRMLGVALANFDADQQVCLFTFTPKSWGLRLDPQDDTFREEEP